MGPGVMVNAPLGEPVQVPARLLQPVVPANFPPGLRVMVAGVAAAGVWAEPDR